jgi:ABC-type transporter Mla subunit MlaD
MRKNKENLEKLQKEVLNLLNKSKRSNYQIGKDTGITEATIGNYRSKKTKPTEANSNILMEYFTGKGNVHSINNKGDNNTNIAGAVINNNVNQQGQVLMEKIKELERTIEELRADKKFLQKTIENLQKLIEKNNL